MAFSDLMCLEETACVLSHFSDVIMSCRFNDIAPNVRRACVQSSQKFLINHPELSKDIAGESRRSC